MCVSKTGRNCSKCDEYKPWSDYYRLKHGINGYASQCKICMNTSCKVYQKKNRTKVQSQQYEYVGKMSGGVYQLHTREGRYVGQSGMLDFRIRNHKCPNSKIRQIAKEVLSWEVLEYIDDKVLRKQREAYYIKKLKPELNKHFTV